jgi:hypothetical protein
MTTLSILKSNEISKLYDQKQVKELNMYSTTLANSIKTQN